MDQAVAEAEKAKADVRSRENHREMSRRHSERVTDWVRDKRKEVEVLRGWMAVDNVSVSAVNLIKLANARSLAERTRSQAERVEGYPSHPKLDRYLCSNSGVTLVRLGYVLYLHNVSSLDLRPERTVGIICTARHYYVFIIELRARAC